MKDELRTVREALAESQRQAAELKEKLDTLTTEADVFKTAAAIEEIGREDEMDNMKRKYIEEMASLQHIMKGEDCH